MEPTFYEQNTDRPLSSIRFEQIFENTNPEDRKTQIICTLGPSCWSVETLLRLIDEGMNVARLNFSHGDHETHAQSVANLKEALK